MARRLKPQDDAPVIASVVDLPLLLRQHSQTWLDYVPERHCRRSGCVLCMQAAVQFRRLACSVWADRIGVKNPRPQWLAGPNDAPASMRKAAERLVATF